MNTEKYLLDSSTEKSLVTLSVMQVEQKPGSGLRSEAEKGNGGSSFGSLYFYCAPLNILSHFQLPRESL